MGSPSRFARGVHLPNVSDREPEILAQGGQVGVTEQQLDLHGVRPVLKHVRGARAPQGVWRDWGKTCGAGVQPQHHADARPGDRTAASPEPESFFI